MYVIVVLSTSGNKSKETGRSMFLLACKLGGKKGGHSNITREGAVPMKIV